MCEDKPDELEFPDEPDRTIADVIQDEDLEDALIARARARKGLTNGECERIIPARGQDDDNL